MFGNVHRLVDKPGWMAGKKLSSKLVDIHEELKELSSIDKGKGRVITSNYVIH